MAPGRYGEMVSGVEDGPMEKIHRTKVPRSLTEEGRGSPDPPVVGEGGVGDTKKQGKGKGTFV